MVNFHFIILLHIERVFVLIFILLQIILNLDLLYMRSNILLVCEYIVFYSRMLFVVLRIVCKNIYSLSNCFKNRIDIKYKYFFSVLILGFISISKQ
jgi:hypothetical protein